MPKIRTTINPDREIEVDDAEYLDLKRQGLLYGEDDETDTPEEPATETAEKPVTKRGAKTDA